MPLCYGGGVNSLEKVERLISIGVEKVAIGYSSFSEPELIKKLENIGPKLVRDQVTTESLYIMK